MAFTYADWATRSGTSAQIAALRAHIAEVASQNMTANVSSGSNSKSGSPNALGYIQWLQAQLAALEAAGVNPGYGAMPGRG